MSLYLHFATLYILILMPQKCFVNRCYSLHLCTKKFRKVFCQIVFYFFPRILCDIIFLIFNFFLYDFSPACHLATDFGIHMSIKKEIENQKNNIAKNSWEKIKNYL